MLHPLSLVSMMCVVVLEWGKWVGVPTLKGNFGDHMPMPTNKPTNGLDMRLKHQQPCEIVTIPIG